jgi:hypothetical protein
MSFPFQEHHGWMDQQNFRLKADTTNPHSPKLKAGTVVKVVMVSRFGDCGITTDLKKTNGYSNRVMPWDLEEIPGVEYRRTVEGPAEGMMKQVYGDSVVPQWPLEVLENEFKDAQEQEELRAKKG